MKIGHRLGESTFIGARRPGEGTGPGTRTPAGGWLSSRLTGREAPRVLAGCATRSRAGFAALPHWPQPIAAGAWRQALQ
jgi:hypothetical protein